MRQVARSQPRMNFIGLFEDINGILITWQLETQDKNSDQITSVILIASWKKLKFIIISFIIIFLATEAIMNR